MTGVEILTATKVVVASTFNFWAAIITFIVCTIIGGIIGYIAAGKWRDWTDGIAGCYLSFLPGLIIAFAVVGITQAPVEYETQYKVTVSDEVPINEFYEKYEVIDQEGKIFTVREKKIND